MANNPFKAPGSEGSKRAHWLVARFPQFVTRHIARIAASEVAFVPFAVALHCQAAFRPNRAVSRHTRRQWCSATFNRGAASAVSRSILARHSAAASALIRVRLAIFVRRGPRPSFTSL
jgi:hypothetical protein